MADVLKPRPRSLALAALLLTSLVSAQTVPVPLPAANPPGSAPQPSQPQPIPLPPPPLPGLKPAPLPTIDPRAALKDLLPAAPKAGKAAVYTGTDLRRVPELRFEAAPKNEMTAEQWHKRKAHTAAAALHLNAREEDGFLKAMLKDRADLAGVPFAMGDKCRTKRPQAALFRQAVEALRALPVTGVSLPTGEFLVRRAEAPNSNVVDKRAHMAAMRQIMGPADSAQRRQTVTSFAAVSHPEASRELARMAVFSPEKAVRDDALEALSVRRERDYTAVLVEALQYPWPAVARNAAEAIVKLERKDLMPRLIDMLDGTDPRGPQSEEAGGKKVTTARELVRVNHHSNCMLCHAPAERGKVPDDVLVAEVPLPTEPLTPPNQGYGSSGSNLLVRIDVTYLRQDFSVMQAVDEKGAWPAMQRFDFVVRKRELTAAEADELRTRLEKREPGVLSPYQKAAVSALREMTGRDFEAKAEPWRRHLKLQSP